MIRVDIDPAQLEKRRDQGLMATADASAFASALADRLPRASRDGALRAARAREAAHEEIPPAYRAHAALLEAIWSDLPDAIIVGDSTQAVYAGCLMLDVPGPRRWFHSATGFGTLGYAAPAAIGAALGTPGRPVICLIGDGGLQFTLAELGSALDCGAEVIFLVWNNRGYQEIENAMVDADIVPRGVKPSAPDFVKVAKAYGMRVERVTDDVALKKAVTSAKGPCLIEFLTP